MHNNPDDWQDFDVVCRHDGSYAIYDYAWWPDEYLDNNEEANQAYLEATWGWRAKGWIVVHVAPTYAAAVRWINNSGEAN